MSTILSSEQPFSFPEDRDMSPELKDLISRMLVKEPTERIALQDIKVRTRVGRYF